MCGEDCPAPGQLHTAAECEVLARARGDIQYTAITVLRLVKVSLTNYYLRTFTISLLGC